MVYEKHEYYLNIKR